MLRLEPVVPSLLVRSLQLRLGLFRQREEIRQMPAPPPRFLVVLAQALQRIVAYRLQKPIARHAAVRFRQYQILVRQRGEQIEPLFGGGHTPGPSLRTEKKIFYRAAGSLPPPTSSARAAPPAQSPAGCRPGDSR